MSRRMFAAVTAEEKGLLGSEYYALHPIFPLATTAANLNLDGAQIAGPAHNLGVQGIPKNTLVDMLATAMDDLACSTAARWCRTARPPN